MSNTATWLKAFRLRTLPLSLSCIFMGSFLAARAGGFRWPIFLLCVLTTVFLQILSNLANDYGDSVHGVDSNARKGPSRTVQSGLISAAAMRSAVILFVVLSLLSGLALLFTAFSSDWNSILAFLGLGVLCIIAAIAYTVGKRPYGYAGLGDLSVFIFFGLVGVAGSYYLYIKSWTWDLLLPASTCGLFSMAVLNVNNVRDIESDREAGKYSVPVRIGRTNAVIYHWCLLAAGLLSSVVYTFIHFRSAWNLLFLLVLPLLFINGKAVAVKPPEQLDPFLRQMAITTLIFVILFGAGWMLV